MLPGVVVFKKMMLYNIKEGNKDADNRCGMYYKTSAPKKPPCAAFKRISLFGLNGTIITESTKQ